VWYCQGQGRYSNPPTFFVCLPVRSEVGGTIRLTFLDGQPTLQRVDPVDGIDPAVPANVHDAEVRTVRDLAPVEMTEQASEDVVSIFDRHRQATDRVDRGPARSGDKGLVVRHRSSLLAVVWTVGGLKRRPGLEPGLASLSSGSDVLSFVRVGLPGKGTVALDLRRLSESMGLGGPALGALPFRFRYVLKSAS